MADLKHAKDLQPSYDLALSHNGTEKWADNFAVRMIERIDDLERQLAEMTADRNLLEVSVNEDERIVREAWEEEFISISFGEVFLCIGQCGVSLPSIRAAAEFTIQRQKQIDDVKEEITDLKATVLMAASTGKTKRETINRRILAARQATLAELQRGWKGTK
jgi:hypothetical protein